MPPLYLPHTSLVILQTLPRSPLLAASSAWLARWFMWLHFSVLVILFTVRFASLRCCLYLSFRRSDLTSTTFFLRVLLFAMACQVFSVIHSFLLLCSSSVDFLRCRFRNVGVLRNRVVSPVPKPLAWRTGGSRFVGPLPFNLSVLGGPTTRLSSRRHSSRDLRGTQARRPRQGGDPSGACTD